MPTAKPPRESSLETKYRRKEKAESRRCRSNAFKIVDSPPYSYSLLLLLFFFLFCFFLCVFYFFDYSVVTAVARAVAKRRDTAHVRSSPPGRSSFRNPEISKLLLLNFSLVRFHFCLIFHALYSPQRTRTKATLVGDKSHTLLFLAFCFFLFLLSYRRHEHLGP